MKKLILFFGLVLISISAHSASYSALAVEQDKGMLSQSKIFVKGNKVRMEYELDGEKYIQISNPQKKRSWVLIPDKKVYIESKTSADLLPKSRQVNIKKICKPKHIACQKQGLDVVNGRKAVKWKLIYDMGKVKLNSYLWVDTKLGIPLKQQYQNGSYSELDFVKNEVVLGRKTQKWKLLLVNPAGEKVEIIQWYDPQLSLTIKEIYPDQSIKELRNIKTINLSDSLFELPKGYKRYQSLH